MPTMNINDYNFIDENHLKKVTYDTAIVTNSEFDPTNPDLSDITILCPTTGDITVSSVPTMVNLAEDINNLHGEPIEMQQLDKWEHTVQFTTITTAEDVLRLALSATVAGKTADGGIVPKSYVSSSDFPTKPLWIIAMQIGGGMFAVKYERYFSTSGFTLTTSKAGKGTSQITLKGFNSLSNMNASPVTYYPINARYTVSFNMQGHGTAIESEIVQDGEKATQPTAPTASGYTFGGWFKEAACTNEWNFSTDTVTSDTVLYAKWTET